MKGAQKLKKLMYNLMYMTFSATQQPNDTNSNGAQNWFPTQSS